MIDRLKRVLVESYVGAVALGFLLADQISHFVNIFASPVAGWVSQNQIREFTSKTTASTGIPYDLALPELIRFILLLVIWYGLVRWLYFKPLPDVQSGPAPRPEENV